MSNRHKATLWIGTEVEQGNDNTTKLFVDGATKEQIQDALESHPDIEEVYFAHGFSGEVVSYLLNKTQVTLEVSQLSDIPSEFKGRVNVVLRVPSYVDGFKMVDDGEVFYTETVDTITEWDGHKVYPSDEVILE